MHRHRLKGNRHPLLTLCTTCPSCLLTADLNDAAGGICQFRPGLVHMPFLKAAVVSGLNLKRTLADVHVLQLSEIKVFLLLTESHDWALRHKLLVRLCACWRKKNNLDFRATNWLNQMFSSFCLQTQVKFWCLYGFTQRRVVFACFWVRQGFIRFCFSYLCMGSAYYIAISVKSMHVCTQEVVHSVALLIRPKVLDTVISDIQASAHINSHAFIFVLICSESTDLCIYFYVRFIILLFLTIKSSHYDLNGNINVDCQGPDLFLKGDTNLLGMKEAKFL